MIFSKKTWNDRTVETPNRRKLKNIEDNVETTYDVTRVEGEVLATGDKFDADTMNNLETRIEQGFQGLATVASTGSYNDLTDKPAQSVVNGKPAPYVEGNLKLYETPTDVRYKPQDGSVYAGDIEIAKYKDDADSISTSIVLKDTGSYLFNFDITPTKTTFWTENELKMGAKIEFADGSHIYVKPVIVAGVLTGFKYSNGKVWSILFETGDFPDFE